MLRKYQKSEQATKENTKNRTSHIGKGADMFLKFLFGDVSTCTETEVRRRLEKHLLETPSLRVYTKEAFGGPKPRVTRA